MLSTILLWLTLSLSRSDAYPGQSFSADIGIERSITGTVDLDLTVPQGLTIAACRCRHLHQRIVVGTVQTRHYTLVVDADALPWQRDVVFVVDGKRAKRTIKVLSLKTLLYVPMARR